MNKPKALIITLLFAMLSLFGIHITLQALTGKGLDNLAYFFPASNGQVLGLDYSGYCSTKAKIPALDQSQDVNIAKLAEYQTVCDSYATNTLMFFTNMPKDKKEAVQMADSMAAKLIEFDKYHLQPLVVVEPQTAWGLVDFKEFGNGFYDPFIDTYFKQLRTDNVPDSAMGTWVPFPEANLPYWNNSNSTPQDFAMVVNKYLGLMKKYFPGAKGSVLLNSATYATTDFNWANGEYLSLVPYVQNLNPAYIDSFGLQGFPWMPQQGDKSKAVLDPGEYLNYKLASEAAAVLGVKKIWLNTGTFAAKYTNTPEATIFMTPEQRKQILANTVAEADKLKAGGFSVSINLFAQNKSLTSEATDWSYWTTVSDNNTNQSVLKDFMSMAEKNNIGVSLFDIQAAK